MHFELNDEQQPIVEAIDRITAERAGPARARQLGGDRPAHDDELASLLRNEGYLGFPFDGDGRSLQAALVVEGLARGCAVVAAGGESLVVPGALPSVDAPGPVAVATLGTTAPIRFAADCRTVIGVADDDVVIVTPDPADIVGVDSRFGYPMARVLRWEGHSLGAAAAAGVRAWWRVALAIELVGTARAALDLTVGHVRERKQFGRPLGAFQGIQHRLAECEVLVQGARWLAMEAAWSGAGVETSTAALTQALRAGERTFWDTHQFSGALGFAVEYDLHLWTMRLPALRAEALAIGNPATALAAARWVEGYAAGVGTGA